MTRIIIMILLALLGGCAGNKKPYALDIDDQLTLHADRNGRLTDESGRFFTLKRFTALLDSGHAAPTAINVTMDKNITMGGVIAMCLELRGLSGSIDIQSESQNGSFKQIACNDAE